MKNKWTIGETANLFDISSDTLRYYEKAGLLRAERDADNGYRHYTYEDLVVLMDILTFRSLEVSVKDIRQILQQMDVAAIKNSLRQNQQQLDKKIAALLRQREQLKNILAQYECCDQEYGHFSIVPAPAFKCKFLSSQAEDLLQIIRQYNQPENNWMHVLRYTLFLPAKALLLQPSLDTAVLGISLDEASLASFSPAAQQEFSRPLTGDCLYTALATDYSAAPNRTLLEAFAWLKAQGRSFSGPLVGRYLASTHKDGQDYYEIWLGLTPA